MTVHAIRVEEVTLGGTIASCLRVDQGSGERVAFYADHREAQAIAEAVAEATAVDVEGGESPELDVEPAG